MTAGTGPQFDFRVVGLVGVQRDLNSVSKHVQNPTRAIMAGAHVLEGEAKLRCPVDTGFLKNSAYVKPVPNDRLAVAVGFNAEYAAAVEYGRNDGTRAGVFFLKGALDAKRADVHAAIRAALLRDV